MKVASAAKTHVGLVREGKPNEDRYLDEAPLFGVADGMGGHLAGDVASSTAVDTILAAVHENPPEATGDLAALVRRANRAIYDLAKRDASMSGMGTTCTLILVSDGRAHLAHVGDSRAYLWRDGEIRQLTDDHTLVNRMVHEGRLRPEEAERHPQRSIITRALGVESEVDVDTETIEVGPGDRLLICSDGLSGMLLASDISEILGSHPDPDEAAGALVQRANEAGGEDNITVVIVDVGKGEERPVSALGTRAGTDPGAEEASALETPPPPPPGPATETRSRPRRMRKVIVLAIVIVVLGGAGFAAARIALDSSWYVGVDDSGRVAIYKGIPDEVAGLTLSSVEETTSLEASELPITLRDGLRDGIKADSLDDARATVADLEDRAEDFSETPEPKPTPSRTGK